MGASHSSRGGQISGARGRPGVLTKDGDPRCRDHGSPSGIPAKVRHVAEHRVGSRIRETSVRLEVKNRVRLEEARLRPAAVRRPYERVSTTCQEAEHQHRPLLYGSAADGEADWKCLVGYGIYTLHPDGVSRSMDHLLKELEPLEFLRMLQTLADFYKSFRRSKGQEFVAYDMEFRRHGQRLEEIGGAITGVHQGLYWL